MSKNACLMTIILLLVLIRIPALLLWNNYLTGNDAAIYLEKGIHLAEGRGFTSSICRFQSDPDEMREYVAKYGSRTQELRVAPLYIFLISCLYSCFGEDHLLLFVNILNLLLFVGVLLVLYFKIVPQFTDDYKIGLMTLILVGLNYVYFEGMFGAHLETLSLFFFVCAFAWHCRISGKDKVVWWDLAGYSVLLALLFLSKYSAIPFVGAFTLHHLIQRKPGRFFTVAFIVTALAGSWFILRDMLLDGRVISNIAQTPFRARAASTHRTFIENYFIRAVTVGRRFIQIISNMDGLAFLVPFSAVYLTGKDHERLKQLTLLLLAISLAFLVYFGYIDARYIYPVFISMIPASLAIFTRMLKKYQPKMAGTALLLLFVVFAAYQLDRIIFYTNAVRTQAADRKTVFSAADKLLAESGVSEEANLLTNILGYNVYSDFGVVMTPSGLTAENKHLLIDIYGIDYVLYCADQLDTQMAWDQYAVKDDVFKDLSLICISSEDPRVRLYSVSDNKPTDKEQK